MSNETSHSGEKRGLVVASCLEGKHGSFAVARVEKLGEVTFSLESDVWQENKKPQEGHEIILSDITRKKAGWRAGEARFFRPEDVLGGE